MLCRVFGGARSFVTFAWCWLAYVIFVVMQVASLTATEFATNLLDVVVSPTGGFPPTMVCMDWHVCLFICNRVCDTISLWTRTDTHTRTQTDNTHIKYIRDLYGIQSSWSRSSLCRPCYLVYNATWVYAKTDIYCASMKDWHLLRFYEGLTFIAFLYLVSTFTYYVSINFLFYCCFCNYYYY